MCTSLLGFCDSSHCVLTRQHFVDPLTNVFDSFIKGKLSSPKGWRSAEDLDEGEIVDVEEDDRVAYADELTSIGNIARAIPHHSLPLLISLLEEQASQCCMLMLVVQQDPGTLRSNQSLLEALYEDLHWLTLIAGYTLCDIAEGEAVLIPTELMKHSIDVSLKSSGRGEDGSIGGRRKEGGASGWSSVGQVTPSAITSTTGTRDGVDFSRNIVALALESDVGKAGSEAVRLLDIDPVVGVVMAVCQLTLLEKKFVSGGLADILSPQLCESVVWCLQRVVEPYVMFNDEDYSQVRQ